VTAKLRVVPEDETAVLPAVSDAPSEDAAEVTAELPSPADAEETTVLPAVPPPGSMDSTTVMSPVPDPAAEPRKASGGDEALATPPEDAPADRVPEWLFRPEGAGGAAASSGAENERTREMPSVQPGAAAQPRKRPRPEWAEETPLDDLPSLADELLGRPENEDDSEGSRGDRPR